MNTRSQPWFVRNDSGRGYRPATKAAVWALHVWDVASWIFAAFFFWIVLTNNELHWWVILLAVVFGAGPWLAAMFFTGRGPISVLFHVARQMRGEKEQ